MKTYNVVIRPAAETDIMALLNHITNVYMEPVTAMRYYEGLMDEIIGLARRGPMFALSQYESLINLYGKGVRTRVYKKMTIVYRVDGDTVYILRILAAGLII
jgi:plasmid stabilization system protein ParE